MATAPENIHQSDVAEDCAGRHCDRPVVPCAVSNLARPVQIVAAQRVHFTARLRSPERLGAEAPQREVGVLGVGSRAT